MNWKRPEQVVAFGFGAGLSPFAPGTAGSALGAIVFWALLAPVPPGALGLTIVLGFALGIAVCGRTAEQLGVPDHGGIVWDEIVGVWITLSAAGGDWRWMILGFFLFRFFDIAKPWPIRRIDAEIHGGLGIMLDDVAAGLLGAAALVGTRAAFGH